jgi:hypothetical protein
VNGNTVSSFGAFECVRHKGAMTIFSDIGEEGFHLIGNARQVRVYGFWVDKSRLVSDVQTESFWCWVNVEVV